MGASHVYKINIRIQGECYNTEVCTRFSGSPNSGSLRESLVEEGISLRESQGRAGCMEGAACAKAWRYISSIAQPRKSSVFWSISVCAPLRAEAAAAFEAFEETPVCRHFSSAR